MNINRHNYEEFFLLYVDNELSATKKNAVDVFVQQNPDLKSELLQLQQAVVKHEQVVFKDKQSLLKEDAFAVIQEKLILFADGELPNADQKQLAELIANDKNVAAEWGILQKTKLQQDNSIVFGDKRSLYRTEGGRVVGFRWWRIAAAAILLGFGIWTGVSVTRQGNRITTGENGLAKNTKTGSSQSKINDVANPVVRPPLKENDGPVTATTATVQKGSIQRPVEKGILTAEKTPNTKGNEGKNNVVITGKNDGGKNRGNNLPVPINPVFENINKAGSNNNAVASVQPKTGDNENGNIPKIDIVENKTGKAMEPAKTITDVNAGAVANTFVQTAVYNGNADEINDNRILYMDENKIKRTRIGGMFRKLKRMIGRNTGIRTGDGIKLAGFEIAVK